MRRLIVAATAVLAAFAGLGVTVPTAEAATVERAVSFSDVKKTHRFAAEISWVANHGLMKGVSSKRFAPAAKLTKKVLKSAMNRAKTPAGRSVSKKLKSSRAGVSHQDLAVTLFKAYTPKGKKAPAGFKVPKKSPFADVSKKHRYYKQIAWLSQAGLWAGKKPNRGLPKFAPKKSAQRQELAVALYRAAGKTTQVRKGVPSSGKVTVAPDVEVLSGSLLQGLRDVSGSSSRGATLTFAGSSGARLSAGDVITAGVTPKTPNGLLVRATEISRTASAAVVRTVPAQITDAIIDTNGLMTLSGTPTRTEFTLDEDVIADDAPFAFAMRRASASSHVAAMENTQDIFQKQFKMSKRIEAKAESSTKALTGSGYVDAEIKVGIGLRGTLTLEADLFGIHKAGVKISPWARVDSKLDAHGEFSGKVKIHMLDLNQTMTFMAGPVPIVLTANEQINANVSVGGQANVLVASTTQVSSDHGFSYQNGSFSLINTKPGITKSSSEVSANASLTTRASVDFDAQVKLYGVVGVTFGFGPYAQAKISVTWPPASWTCPVELGVQSRVGVVAGIDIMGFKLGDWQKTWSKDWPLKQLNPCVGKPAPDPGSGSVIIAGVPTISGTPEVGQTLTLNPGTWSPAGVTLSYRWLRGGLAISGATSSSYTIPPGDDGRTISVRVTGSYPGMVAKAATSSPVVIGDGGTGELGVNFGQINVGEGHVLATGSDGATYAWGLNWYEWFYREELNRLPRPTPSPQGLTFVQVAAGFEHSLALDADGKAYAWGSGYAGQLGIGIMGDSDLPVPVVMPEGVFFTQVAAGKDYSLALGSDGQVYAWGDNYREDPALSEVRRSLVPEVVEVPAGVLFTQISTKGCNAMAVGTDGRAFVWGINWSCSRQLGATLPTSPAPLTMPHGVDAVQVSAGPNDSLILGSNGKAYIWRPAEAVMNDQVELVPMVTVPSGVVFTQLAAGTFHSLALGSDGRAYAWGANFYGSLGGGAIDESQAFDPLPVVMPPGVTFTQLGAGLYLSVGLGTDGRAYVWGNNEEGKLGDGSQINRSAPVPVRMP